MPNGRWKLSRMSSSANSLVASKESPSMTAITLSLTTGIAYNRGLSIQGSHPWCKHFETRCSVCLLVVSRPKSMLLQVVSASATVLTRRRKRSNLYFSLTSFLKNKKTWNKTVDDNADDNKNKLSNGDQSNTLRQLITMNRLSPEKQSWRLSWTLRNSYCLLWFSSKGFNLLGPCRRWIIWHSFCPVTSFHRVRISHSKQCIPQIFLRLPTWSNFILW